MSLNIYEQFELEWLTIDLPEEHKFAYTSGYMAGADAAFESMKSAFGNKQNEQNTKDNV